MENSLKDSLLLICRTLEKHNVKYMLIGGTAVALNGYYRPSINSAGEIADKPDIDIWYDPTYENYFNVLESLQDLGEDITGFKNEQNPNPRKSFFRYELDDFTLELLPEIKTKIKFSDANKRKETVFFEGAKIHFINYVDLLEDKKATARKKDLEDIDNLKKLRGED